MGRDLWYRCRLLIYAVAAALGGVIGSRGKFSILWIIIPPFTVILVATLLRIRGWRAVSIVIFLVFLYAGLYLGYARASSWQGRGGSAGEVVLVGEVEVGCQENRVTL